MVTISLRPSTVGRWSISRAHITLFSDLQLGPAIKLAREVARDEHLRSRRAILVEMPGPEAMIILARYGDRDCTNPCAVMMA